MLLAEIIYQPRNYYILPLVLASVTSVGLITSLHLQLLDLLAEIVMALQTLLQKYFQSPPVWPTNKIIEDWNNCEDPERRNPLQLMYPRYPLECFLRQVEWDNLVLAAFYTLPQKHG